MVPHPSKKDEFPFWTAHVILIYNLIPKNIKYNFFIFAVLKTERHLDSLTAGFSLDSL